MVVNEKLQVNLPFNNNIILGIYDFVVSLFRISTKNSNCVSRVAQFYRMSKIKKNVPCYLMSPQVQNKHYKDAIGHCYYRAEQITFVTARHELN